MIRKTLKTLLTSVSLTLIAASAHGATLTVETTRLGGTDWDSKCSLDEAIENAEADSAINANCEAGSGADIIQLPSGTYQITTPIKLSSSIAFEGMSADDHPILNLKTTEYAVRILDSADIAFQGLDFTGSTPEAFEVSGGELSLKDSSLLNFTALRSLIAIENGALDLKNVNIANNSYEDLNRLSGNVLRSSDSSLSLEGVILTRNTFNNACEIEGEIQLSGGNLTVRDSAFDANTLKVSGEFCTDGSTVAIAGGFVSAYGGASVEIVDTSFDKNSIEVSSGENGSTITGGLIKADAETPSFSLNTVTFNENSYVINGEYASVTGGLIQAFSTVFTLKRVQISENQIDRNDGVLNVTGGFAYFGVINSMQTPQTSTITQSEFSRNEIFVAPLAGEVPEFVAEGTTLYLYVDTFENSGCDYGDIAINNTTISTNLVDFGYSDTADEIGWSLLNMNGTVATYSGYCLDLSHTTIAKNTFKGINPEVTGFSSTSGLYLEPLLSTDETTTFNNTILAENAIYSSSTTESEDTLYSENDIIGYIISEGHNLVQNPTSALDHMRDSTDVFNIDPNLPHLDDNGGPTETHVIHPFNIAYGQGSDCMGEDQRGAYSIGLSCDIGAYQSSGEENWLNCDDGWDNDGDAVTDECAITLPTPRPGSTIGHWF